MFITDNSPPPIFVDSNDSFVVSELLWISEKQSKDNLYRQVVFKVLRKPNALTFHIQRIYLTYGSKMRDQLYAALVDLLWILDGSGRALSSRMIASTQSLLSEKQIENLMLFLEMKNNHLMVGNKFSVCVAGNIGTKELVIKKNHIERKVDPLELARDYINYSQLDEALKTLEDAFFDAPERQDIQTELLDLLKSTKNNDAFIRIRNAYLKKELDVSGEWQEMTDYFSKK